MHALRPAFVIGLFGARRTGKTVLMNAIRERLGDASVLMVQGDDLDIAEVLASQRLSILRQFVEGYDYLFVDEAQKVPNIGNSLKLIVDSIPGLSIFITGSSALDLLQQTGEPLTGRSRYFHLFPFIQTELDEDFITFKTNLEERLIYGCYPQVVNAETAQEKTDVLNSIKNGYLLKDVLELDNQKDSTFILKLLRLIAFQIGNDISYAELASQLNVNAKTVQRYLAILEKVYVLFSLQGFSRNLRKEYSKTPRYYFWDNGIRNCLIPNFNRFVSRDDHGKLWENYAISEWIKRSIYHQEDANFYFWRTYDQQEIDLIMEQGGAISGWEFKWNPDKIVKPPAAFSTGYPDATFTAVHPENILELLK